MTEIIVMLMLLMIAGAIVAIETTSLLFSVISVGAVGFLVSIAFLFLGAPDIAIVQIGVEVISLVILIRATVGREAKTAVGGREFFGERDHRVVERAAHALDGMHMEVVRLPGRTPGSGLRGLEDAPDGSVQHAVELVVALLRR